MRCMANRATTSASTLFMGAWSYKNAMQLLAGKVDQPGQHNLNAPYFLLAGFSFELALKAVLRATGMTDDQLRKLSHDLSGSYKAALLTGFAPTNATRLVDVITKLCRPHGEFLMRYIPAGVDAIGLPHPDLTLDVLVVLLNDIEDQVPSILDEMPDEDEA